MKTRFLSPIVAASLMLIASSASAYMLNDTYWGDEDHGYKDIVSSAADENHFDIQGADAYVHGNSLTVKIYTGFAGRGDEEWFKKYTENHTGLGYGDLFLSTGWTPYTDTGTNEDYPHLLADNATNGNHWTYAFAVDNPFRGDDATGSGTIYELPGTSSSDQNPGVLTSNDFMTGATFRDGQAVAVNTSYQGVKAVRHLDCRRQLFELHFRPQELQPRS